MASHVLLMGLYRFSAPLCLCVEFLKELMMKKLYALALLLMQVGLFAGEVGSYEELADAMRTGERFTFVVNLQEMTCNFSMPIGYFVPSKMMLIGAVDHQDEKIVTSDLHFTDCSGIPTYEYVKYTFAPDNTLHIRLVVYSTTFVPLAEHDINCSIGNGVKIKTS